MHEYEVEVWDRDGEEFVLLDPEDIVVEYGVSVPARLLHDGVELRVRFRVWQVVSAGTDRLMILEAISGLPALFSLAPA